MNESTNALESLWSFVSQEWSFVQDFSYTKKPPLQRFFRAFCKKNKEKTNKEQNSIV
jgi:hypothetical protein